MVDQIQAKFMPGLDRELNARVDPLSMLPGVQGILDLTRWLVPEEIVGAGVQFFDASIAGPSLTTPIRIPARKGKIIGIYNTNLLVNTLSTTTSLAFKLIAGTVIEGGVGDTSGTYVRQHGQLRVGAVVGINQNPRRVLSGAFGVYVVRGGMDYVVGFNAVAAVSYQVAVAVMGYYFDEGMWPIGK